MRLTLALAIVLSLPLAGLAVASGADLDQLEQQAIAAAVKSAANSLVQIRTIGGVDQLEGQTLAQGPTTGVIVSEDGLVVSSAFNFAQQPTSILVQFPDGERRPARIVGRDDNRMLVLLQVENVDLLPVAEPAPLDAIRPGDWSIALGRSYDSNEVSVSVGVVSALRRMHGRAIQTDANVSAVNYGGPLIDLEGRVLGILVPMAPPGGPSSGEANVMAGAEYYDSGIGFAVPLSDILAMLDRWVDEEQLSRGLLGIGLKPGNPHSTAPIITNVWPRSPAALAGWKADDRIVSVDGVRVDSQTALRFQTTPRYAGDQLAVTIRRGDGDDAKEIETKVTLASKLPPYLHPFLGVLPARLPPAGAEKSPDGAAAETKAAPNEAEEKQEPSADEQGEEAKPTQPAGLVIRAVWPDSPADKAGLRPGDHIVRMGDKKVASLNDAVGELNAKSPDDDLAIIAQRGDEELDVEVKLAELPTDVLETSDLHGDEEQQADLSALGDPQLRELKLPEMSQTARYFQPPGEGAPPGLVIWLGDNKKGAAEATADAWQRTCVRDRLVLLMPEPADAAGWTNDDLEYLARLLQTAGSRWQIDPRRVIVAGEGRGGQLAYALAIQGRKLIRGVAVVDSPLPRTLAVPENNPNERLAIFSVETQNTPLSLLIRKDLKKLADAGYPVTQITRRGDQKSGEGLDATTRGKLGRWIDGLDRL